MNPVPVFILVATTLSQVGVPSLTSEPDKVLPVQNTRGINQTFLRPVPLGPLLPPGANQTTWQLTAENEFRQNTFLREDGENWRLRYTYRWAQNQGEWLTTIPLIHRGGGVLDPFINWWHINIVQHKVPARETTPYGRYGYNLHDGSRPDSGTGIGDITLAYRFRRPAAPQLSIKLPTGNPSLLMGSGGFDLGISGEHQFNLSPLYDFTAQASLVYQSPSSGWSETRPLILTYTLALAYQPNPSQTWILQFTSETASIRNNEPYHDQENRIASLGYSQATRNGTWTYWISEDGDIGWFNFNKGLTVGADFTFGIRFTQKK